MAQFVNVQNGKVAAAGVRASASIRAAECNKSNYASLLGDICERRLVYWRTHGDKAIPPSDGLRALFASAKLLTPIFLDRVFNPFGRKQTPAWEVLEQERRPSDPLFLKLRIGLKADGIRHVADAAGRMRPYNLVEFKSINGNLFSRIEDRDSLGMTYWTAKYPDQVLLGMLGCEITEHPAWLVIFNRDCIYECKIIEIPFDEDRCERLLSRSERINKHVEEGTLPRQICRPDICQNCAFLPVCSPKLEADPEDAPVIMKPGEDDELHKLLSDHVLLEDSRKEADAIKKKLKGRLVPGQTLVSGPIVVNWKVHGKGWRMNVQDTSADGLVTEQTGKEPDNGDLG